MSPLSHWQTQSHILCSRYRLSLYIIIAINSKSRKVIREKLRHDKSWRTEKVEWLKRVGTKRFREKSRGEWMVAVGQRLSWIDQRDVDVTARDRQMGPSCRYPQPAHIIIYAFYLLGIRPSFFYFLHLSCAYRAFPALCLLASRIGKD